MHVLLCLFLLVHIYVCGAALVMFPCSTVAVCGNRGIFKCLTTTSVCVQIDVCGWRRREEEVYCVCAVVMAFVGVCVGV